MAVSSVKFLLLFATIISLMLHNVNCEIQWTGSAEAFGTPELYTQQAENHHEIKALLQSQTETLTRMADTQTRIAATQTCIANNSATVQNILQNQVEQQEENHLEMKDLLQHQIETLTQMENTQTQMANAFGQIVTLLQNMSSTMNRLNTVVSVLEDQQETLESISRSFPVVLEQQATQTELLSQCQPRPKSNCSDVESSNRFQTIQGTIITTDPTTMTSTERITQDTNYSEIC